MQNLLDEFTRWEKKVNDVLEDISANNTEDAPEDFANVQELVQVLLSAAAQGKSAILVS
jgi:ferritin-like protein